MIAFPSSVRVWLAVGRTDIRRSMNGLALQVQQALGRDAHAGDLYVFRGADLAIGQLGLDHAVEPGFGLNGAAWASAAAARRA